MRWVVKNPDSMPLKPLLRLVCYVDFCVILKEKSAWPVAGSQALLESPDIAIGSISLALCLGVPGHDNQGRPPTLPNHTPYHHRDLCLHVRYNIYNLFIILIGRGTENPTSWLVRGSFN